MGLVIADAKIKIKRSTEAGIIPTRPESDDHTDGSWNDTDIYTGEFFLNIPDGRLWIGVEDFGTGDKDILEITSSKIIDDLIEGMIRELGYIRDDIKDLQKDIFITVDLIDKLDVIFYAFVEMEINSIDNVKNAPAITIEVEDVAYVLGSLIEKGSKIKVIADIASVVNLRSNTSNMNQVYIKA